MKRLILAVVMALSASAVAAEYEIDPAHSSAQFSVRHMMVTNVKGTFGKITGKVSFNEKDPTRSTAEASIDATTIDTKEQKRDDHLRSADFFDVEKYPTIDFKSKKWAKAGKGKFKVTGDLTLHGVTKEVVLNVDEWTDEVKDPWGNSKRGATASTKLNRKDFGLTWNKNLERGGVLVGDEVKINLDLELLRKDPAPPAPEKAKDPLK